MKVALCLQHVSFEGPGVFRRALETRGYRVRSVLVPVDGLPSDPGDFLLIMGGPMSVNDPDSWIEAELHFVKTVLRTGIPVLGICFGAQLLAKALGGSVAPGPKFEIGMVSVSLTEIGKDRSQFWVPCPKTFPVFQWHGEGMTLPSGSAHLATSADFPVQAFRMKDRHLWPPVSSGIGRGGHAGLVSGMSSRCSTRRNFTRDGPGPVGSPLAQASSIGRSINRSFSRVPMTPASFLMVLCFLSRWFFP